METLKVGDIVNYTRANRWLHSGGDWYPYAIVVQVEPLVLVSEETDMRWSKSVAADEFTVIGTATPDVLERCMSRL